jgi:hypothetical protein
MRLAHLGADLLDETGVALRGGQQVRQAQQITDARVSARPGDHEAFPQRRRMGRSGASDEGRDRLVLVGDQRIGVHDLADRTIGAAGDFHPRQERLAEDHPDGPVPLDHGQDMAFVVADEHGQRRLAEALRGHGRATVDRLAESVHLRREIPNSSHTMTDGACEDVKHTGVVPKNGDNLCDCGSGLCQARAARRLSRASGGQSFSVS